MKLTIKRNQYEKIFNAIQTEQSLGRTVELVELEEQEMQDLLAIGGFIVKGSMIHILNVPVKTFPPPGVPTA